MLSGVIAYLREARVELKKVTWPTRQQTLRYTVAVVLMSLSIAAYLGALDALFSFLIRVLTP